MTLSKWIDRNGGRVLISKRLGVTPQTVHYWLARKSWPRWETAQKILSISKGAVTYADIFRPKMTGARR